MKLRRQLFQDYLVDEVTNLTAIRRELFNDVIGPACLLVVGRGSPQRDAVLFYYAPKPNKTAGLSKDFSIEPQDVSTISQREAAEDPWVWSVLALGGSRDVNLIRKLRDLPTLEKLESEGKIKTRVGVIPGNRAKELSKLRGRRYFDLTNFPEDVFIELDASRVPKWDDPRTSSKDSTDFEAFKNPQLLIKQSYPVGMGRFRAALVRSDDPTWGVICKKTYLSVRDCDLDADHINTACVVYNSLLAVYFLALTSSRLGYYRTEILTDELVKVPLPNSKVNASGLSSFKEIDDLTRGMFALSEAEWALVEDFLGTVFPDTLRKAPGSGRERTTRVTDENANEPELTTYAQTFERVLKSTFGKDKQVASTIFQEPETSRLPVRVLTLHFDCQDRGSVSVQQIESKELLDRLAEFHSVALGRTWGMANGGGLAFRRVAFFLHADRSGEEYRKNLTVIKPDERRYWTRSQAMRDADELSAAILKVASERGGP
jgi:hypothetical protein